MSSVVERGPSTTSQPSQQDWNKNEPKYRCWCQYCHVTHGAAIIGVVEAVWILITIGILPSASNQSNFYNNAHVVGYLVGAVIGAVVIGYLWCGIMLQRPTFLLLHLVFQVIALVLLAVHAVVCVRDLIKTGDRFFVIILIVEPICVVLEIWFFNVIFAAYKFLKDKQRADVLYLKNMYGEGHVVEGPPPAYPGIPAAATQNIHHF